jgi:hypothetical protein
MNDLRRFQRMVTGMLAAGLLLAGAPLLATGNTRLALGLVAGGLLGIVNLTWLVGTVGRLSTYGLSTRRLQLAGMVRFLVVAVMFGALLILGHAHPVGTVIGYGLFPLAAVAAGFVVLGRSRRAAT